MSKTFCDEVASIHYFSAYVMHCFLYRRLSSDFFRARSRLRSGWTLAGEVIEASEVERSLSGRRKRGSGGKKGEEANSWLQQLSHVV